MNNCASTNTKLSKNGIYGGIAFFIHPMYQSSSSGDISVHGTLPKSVNAKRNGLFCDDA
jgi:hypothetical protein